MAHDSGGDRLKDRSAFKLSRENLTNPNFVISGATASPVDGRFCGVEACPERAQRVEWKPAFVSAGLDQSFPRVILLLVLILLTTTCGSNNNTNAQFRLMDASPGETSLTVTLGGTAFTSAVTYGTASPYTFVLSGSPTLEVQGPSIITGNTTTLFNGAVTLNQSTTYTAVGDNYPLDFGVTLYVDNNSLPTSGNFNLRIINSAPGLGTVDAYVVAPGTDLSSTSPKVAGLAFQAASAYLPMSAGTYEVYFTLAGQKKIYIDSGPVSFSTTQVRTIVALNGATSGYTDAVLADLN